MDAYQRQAAWEAHDARLRGFSARWREKVRSEFRREHLRVRAAASGNWLRVVRGSRQRWLALLTELWRAAAEEFGGNLARHLGARVIGSLSVAEAKALVDRPGEKRSDWDFDPWSEEYQAEITPWLLKKANEIMATTTKRLRAALAKAKKAVADTVEDAVDRVYKWFEGSRAQAIVDTESHQASSASSEWAAWDSGVVKTKLWVTQRDSRVRASHARCDGVSVGMDEVFPNGLEYPGDPNGPFEETCNCFPGNHRPIVQGTLEKVYRRHYEGEVVRVELTPDGSGPSFTVTPNHPVLTYRGWVQVGELQKGDHLVRADLLGCLTLSDHEDEDPPPTFEQIFRTHSIGGSRKRVTAGSVIDFHSDGREGEVEIVETHPSLALEGVTSLQEHNLELSFPLSYSPATNLSFHGGGHLSRCSQKGSTLGCSLSHPEKHRIGASARSNTLYKEVAADVRPRYLENLGYLLDGGAFSVEASDLPALVNTLTGGGQGVGLFSGSKNTALCENSSNSSLGDAEGPNQTIPGLPTQIAPAEVFLVDRFWYSGHVYNLQTSLGFYTVEDIPFHNCRCFAVYSLASGETAEDVQEVY